MTDAEKMREAAAQLAEDHDIPGMYQAMPMPFLAGYEDACQSIAAAIRALPVDASAPAADCQQAGLVTVGAGLLDEVKAALALLTERARGLVFAHHHGNGLEGWHNTVDGVDLAITAARAALARLEREVG